MLLVDSSVWIDWLRGAATNAVRFVQAREPFKEIVLTQMIYLEVLQGVSSDRSYAECQRVLGAQTMLQPLDALGTFEATAQFYRKARKKGLIICKSTDCLIAAIALEQGGMLVHKDRNFIAVAVAEPMLVLYPAPLH